MGDSALCASLKSGKRLIISIICTICCGVKKNPYFLLQNRGVLPLRTHFVIALFFNFFRVHWEQRERLHTYVTSRITYFLQGGLFL